MESYGEGKRQREMVKGNVKGKWRRETSEGNAKERESCNEGGPQAICKAKWTGHFALEPYIKSCIRLNPISRRPERGSARFPISLSSLHCPRRHPR